MILLFAACTDGGPAETADETGEAPAWEATAMTDFAACGSFRALAMDPAHVDYLYLLVPYTDLDAGPSTQTFSLGEGGVTAIVEVNLAFDAATACSSAEENPPFGARWWRATEGALTFTWMPAEAGDAKGEDRLGDVAVEVVGLVFESMVSPPEEGLTLPSMQFEAPVYVVDLPA